MAGLRVAELARARTGPDMVDRVVVGPDDTLLDGEPFPWATVGPWVLRIEDGQMAVLNLSIVVTLPPPEVQ